jgi:hypothetical protein
MFMILLIPETDFGVAYDQQPAKVDVDWALASVGRRGMRVGRFRTNPETRQEPEPSSGHFHSVKSFRTGLPLSSYE